LTMTWSSNPAIKVFLLPVAWLKIQYS
jgi:hypothetical protein